LTNDNESEPGDSRTEGMNAHVFSSSIGANGYIPLHKEPPRYIKVRAHHKKEREFNRIFLAQELSGSKHKAGNGKTPGVTANEVRPDSGKSEPSGGAIWATEFSKDGRYLAAAGQDQLVRVWAVISTAEERRAHEQEEDASGGHGERLSAPVFRSKPIREFEGHTGTVLDLSWSKNNFLLSSSVDKTVRLWHISRQECLCTFRHKDSVTSISFHPTDDRFYLSGSLDSVMRLWSIPDKSVAFWNQLPGLITAVAFTPDGKTAIGGVLNGLCLFYETEGLKYNTQIHVRSSRGKNAKGSKITGIRTVMYPPNDPEGEVKVLITSNDSRVRLYNLRDKSLEMKFRGHENSCSQIKASFSDDVKYIICGSEDRKSYLWSTGPAESETKDKRPVELFEAHSSIVTTAVMAPMKTRQLLGASGDPIYDLCNPPPITLLSRAESHVSHEKRDSDAASEPQSKKPEESPAYIARSTHPDGNIIITADQLGTIKVFRQDCAHQKRRNDLWESGPTFKKMNTGINRTGSIINRTSGTHSRRNSTSQISISTQPPSDRILSWRNDVTTNGAHEAGSIRTIQTSRSERSVSPGKFSQVSAISVFPPQHTTMSQPNLALSARTHPYTGTPTTDKSPSQSLYKSSTSTTTTGAASQPPTPSFSLYSINDDANPLRLDSAGKSYQFWNKQNWRSNAQSNTGATASPSTADPSKLGSELSKQIIRGNSVVSRLSSDEGSRDGNDDDEDGDSDSDAVACRGCGGRDFRARKGGTGKGKGAGAGVGVVRRLVCTKCGLAAE
jgi:WD repeat-containing protein 44